MRGKGAADDARHILRRQGIGFFVDLKPTVDSVDGLAARRQVKIGCAPANGGLQKFMQ